MSDNIIYTCKDIMKIMQIGRNAAYNLMKSPCFPSIKIGGTYRVSEEAFNKWLKTYEGKQVII